MAMKKLIGAAYMPLGSADVTDPRGAPWNRTAEQGGKWFPLDNGAWPDRMPKRGPYNEADPAVIDDQLREANRAGIDFFAVCWFYSSARKLSGSSAAIENMAASSYDATKFHIAFDSKTDPDSPVKSMNDVNNICAMWDDLFKSSTYLRLPPRAGNSRPRPVVNIVKMDHFHNSVAPAAGLSHRALLDKIREWTGEDIYFYGSTVNLGYWFGVLKDAGYDGTGAYNIFTNWSGRDTNSPVPGPSPKSFAELMAVYRGEWQYMLGNLPGQPPVRGKLQDLGMEYVLPFSAGFDDTPWHPDNTPVGFPTHDELYAHALECFTYAEASPLVRMCFLDAWNEFFEGSFVEPCHQQGRMKCGAIKKASGR